MKKDLYFLLLNLILIIIFLGILLFFSCESYPTNNVNGYLNVEGYQDKKMAYTAAQTKKANADTSVRSSTNPVTSYQADALDIQYHYTIDDIKSQSGLDAYSNTINVYDKSGNLVQLNVPAKMANATYYDPGAMRYDPSSFVPSYDDTVYFSKLTGLSYAKPIENTNQQLGGFCLYNRDSPENLEKACNILDKNTCASTSCCVLLGGQKCVSGDENGPKIQANYSDPTIVNPDKYFYNGKCYGNCVNSMSTNNSLYDYNPFSSAFPINTPESILAAPAPAPALALGFTPAPALPTPHTPPSSVIPHSLPPKSIVTPTPHTPPSTVIPPSLPPKTIVIPTPSPPPTVIPPSLPPKTIVIPTPPTPSTVIPPSLPPKTIVIPTPPPPPTCAYVSIGTCSTAGVPCGILGNYTTTWAAASTNASNCVGISPPTTTISAYTYCPAVPCPPKPIVVPFSPPTPPVIVPASPPAVVVAPAAKIAPSLAVPPPIANKKS